MKKLSALLALTTFILFETNLGWCAGSGGQAFKLSVTIPQTVALVGEEKTRENGQMTGNAIRIVQEERLKRNNQLVLVKSIVPR